MHMHVIRPGIQSAWLGAATPDITELEYLPTSCKQPPYSPAPPTATSGPLLEALHDPMAVYNRHPSAQAARYEMLSI